MPFKRKRNINLNINMLLQLLFIFVLSIVDIYAVSKSKSGDNNSGRSNGGKDNSVSVAVAVGQVSLVASDVKAILDRGYLVVAIYNKSKPPFSAVIANDDEELRGLDADFAKRISDKLGVGLRYNFSPTSYNDVVDVVARGEADIGISKLSFTYSRASKVLYTKTYSKLNKSILVNRLLMSRAKSERKAKTLRDILNHPSVKIGVIEKSSYVPFARDLFPNATIVEISTDDWQRLASESISRASGGEINAIFRDNLEIQKILTFSPKANLFVAPYDLKGENDYIRMVVGPESHRLRQIVDEVIDSSFDMQYDIRSLLKKYKHTL